MDDRKWEDLPVDCLENIFARVGLESLVDWVPYVCKSWHRATLSPQCWQSLDFQGGLPISVFYWRLKSFVKFVIRRSRGAVNAVKLPNRLSKTEEVLTCIAEGCPSLKLLDLPSCYSEILPSLICKWKDLEALRICTKSSLLEIVISQISIHCNKFISLTAFDTEISQTAASGIATLLPNIKFLSLRFSRIEKSDLVVILKGCKELVYLDVGNCYGFEVDDEILNLAAHLTTFKFEGVSLYYDDPYYDDPYEYSSPSYLDLDYASNSD